MACKLRTTLQILLYFSVPTAQASPGFSSYINQTFAVLMINEGSHQGRASLPMFSFTEANLPQLGKLGNVYFTNEDRCVISSVTSGYATIFFADDTMLSNIRAAELPFAKIVNYARVDFGTLQMLQFKNEQNARKMPVTHTAPEDDLIGEFTNMPIVIRVNVNLEEDAYRRVLIHEGVRAAFANTGISGYQEVEESIFTIIESASEDILNSLSK